ncbi:MAG: serine hydrolase [Verrucomicrobia bacterium]|nr:serine hydrolase [Verrucomicrobiota bacterium]
MNHLSGFSLLLLVGVWLPSPSHAEAPRLADVLAQVRERTELPSIACVVFRGDKVLEEAAVGVRKVGSKETVTLDDQYHIGSLTKSMTATLAAMEVQAGEIRWDSTVQQILGPTIADIDGGYREVTLRQLLQHRGGVPHDPPGELWDALWRHGAQPAAANRAWFVAEILRRKPAQEAGRFAYSNTGYMIAGEMLETVTSRAWETVVRAKLCVPLGMKSAGFGAAASPGKIDQPWGHVKGKPIPPGPQADNPPALGPAGTVHCSVRDLAKYAAFHLREGTGKPRLLDPAAFEILHVPPPGEQTDPYAMGWLRVPRDWAAGDALTHNGSNTMNYAVIWLAPRRDFGLVVVTNEGRSEAAGALDQVAAAMVTKYCPPEKPSR